MNFRRIGIVILAAGGSTRMGRPKQLLSFQGNSFIGRAAEIAIETGADPVVAVLGASEEGILQQLRDLPIHRRSNPHWQRGMGSSIRVGVASLLELEPALDGILITLCDQPKVSVGTLNKVAAAYRQSGKALCAAAFNGTVSPPALFGRKYFDELLTLPDEAGAKRVLLKHSHDLVQIDCPEAASDVDTPEQYAALTSMQ